MSMLFFLYSNNETLAEFCKTILIKHSYPHIKRKDLFNNKNERKENYHNKGVIIIKNIKDWETYKKYSFSRLIILSTIEDIFVADTIKEIMYNVSLKIKIFTVKIGEINDIVHKIGFKSFDQYLKEKLGPKAEAEKINFMNDSSAENVKNNFCDFEIENSKKYQNYSEKIIEKINLSIENFRDIKKLMSWVEYISKPQVIRNKDHYYMGVAKSTENILRCIRRSVGAVIVKNDTIIATGFNGTPKSILNCTEGGCTYCARNKSGDISETMCICIHAEASAILSSDKNSLVDSTLYTTVFPCRQCVKIIIQAEIKEVFYLTNYKCKKTDDESKKIFYQVGIKVCQIIQDFYFTPQY